MSLLRRARVSVALACAAVGIGCGTLTGIHDLYCTGDCSGDATLMDARAKDGPHGEADVLHGDSGVDAPRDAGPDDKSSCTPASCPSGEACDPTSGVCSTNCAGGLTCNGGCCNGAKCVSGNSDTQCGSSGGKCVTCVGATPTCASGACTAQCDGGACGAGFCCGGSAGTCMVGTAMTACGSASACVDCAGKNGSACLGGGTCGCKTEADCLPGNACNGGACSTTCGSASPCNGGCCSGTTCQPGTSSGACGSAGGICSDCAGKNGSSCLGSGTCGCNTEADCLPGNACNGGACSATCSGSSPCNGGCCAGTTCKPGTNATACGVTGAACASCGGSTPVCSGGSCTCDGGSCGGGTLTGSVVLSTTTVDLTSVGTSDWAHWGYATATSFDHKATGGSQISDYTLIGSGPVSRFTGALRTFSWSDGTPTASAVASSTNIFLAGVGNGFSITVPADTTTRTLEFYIGGGSSFATLVAHLSDGSAADYVDSSIGNSTTRYLAVFTLTYASATSGAEMTVSWTEITDSGGGDLVLQAAALH